jgi:hypothetical protein
MHLLGYWRFPTIKLTTLVIEDCSLNLYFDFSICNILPRFQIRRPRQTTPPIGHSRLELVTGCFDLIPNIDTKCSKYLVSNLW